MVVEGGGRAPINLSKKYFKVLTLPGVIIINLLKVVIIVLVACTVGSISRNDIPIDIHQGVN